MLFLKKKKKVLDVNYEEGASHILKTSKLKFTYDTTNNKSKKEVYNQNHSDLTTISK